MTLEQLKTQAMIAKKATGSISEATPDEISALFSCPDLLISAIKKIEETQAELKNIISG